MDALFYNNLKGKPWDFAMTQRMDFTLDMEVGLSRWESIDSVIGSSGKMLQFPLIGSKMYDLILEFFEIKFDRTKVKTMIKSITETIGIYDFALESRNMIVRPDYGSAVMSKIMRVVMIVIKGYNMGRLERLDSSNKTVLMSNAMDPMDYQLAITIEANNRPSIRNNVKMLPKIFDTDKKRYQKYFRTLDTYNILDVLPNVEDKELVDIMNRVHNANVYSYFNHLFYEFTPDFSPDYDLLETASWEREDANASTSQFIDQFKFIVNHSLEADVFKERKFYVRDKGVRIVFNKPVFDLESIDVREYHSEDSAPYEEHYIVYFYTLTTGETRMVYLDMTNIESVTIPLMYEKDAEITMYVLAWLGLLDTTHFNDEFLERKFIEVNQEEVEPKIISMFTENLNKLVKHSIDTMHPDNFTYYTPAQWNYSVYGSQKQSDIFTPTAPKKLVKVGRYSRKLPAGQVASQEAIALAKKCFIELKEGYTLVDEHEKVARRSNR